jgi:lipopolysaccharide biosynthesis glycosyltransferase
MNKIPKLSYEYCIQNLVNIMSILESMKKANPFIHIFHINQQKINKTP